MRDESLRAEGRRTDGHEEPNSRFLKLFKRAVKRKLINPHTIALGTAVAQWLRCCATNRKVAGSIPDGVGIFH